MATIIALPSQSMLRREAHEVALEMLGGTFLVADTLYGVVDEYRRDPLEPRLMVIDYEWGEVYRDCLLGELRDTQAAQLPTLLIYGMGGDVYSDFGLRANVVGVFPLTGELTTHLPDMYRAYADLNIALGEGVTVSHAHFAPVLKKVLEQPERKRDGFFRRVLSKHMAHMR